MTINLAVSDDRSIVIVIPGSVSIAGGIIPGGTGTGR
jgi:hypothetical protein